MGTKVRVYIVFTKRNFEKIVVHIRFNICKTGQTEVKCKKDVLEGLRKKSP